MTHAITPAIKEIANLEQVGLGSLRTVKARACTRAPGWVRDISEHCMMAWNYRIRGEYQELIGRGIRCGDDVPFGWQDKTGHDDLSVDLEFTYSRATHTAAQTIDLLPIITDLGLKDVIESAYETAAAETPHVAPSDAVRRIIGHDEWNCLEDFLMRTIARHVLGLFVPQEMDILGDDVITAFLYKQQRDLYEKPEPKPEQSQTKLRLVPPPKDDVDTSMLVPIPAPTAGFGKECYTTWLEAPLDYYIHPTGRLWTFRQFDTLLFLFKGGKMGCKGGTRDDAMIAYWTERRENPYWQLRISTHVAKLLKDGDALNILQAEQRKGNPLTRLRHLEIIEAVEYRYCVKLPHVRRAIPTALPKGVSPEIREALSDEVVDGVLTAVHPPSKKKVLEFVEKKLHVNEHWPRIKARILGDKDAITDDFLDEWYAKAKTKNWSHALDGLPMVMAYFDSLPAWKKITVVKDEEEIAIAAEKERAERADILGVGEESLELLPVTETAQVASKQQVNIKTDALKEELGNVCKTAEELKALINAL